MDPVQKLAAEVWTELARESRRQTYISDMEHLFRVLERERGPAAGAAQGGRS